MTHPRLRFARLWWTAGWMLVAFIVYGSLKPTVDIPGGWMSDKMLHFSGYCAVAFWFVGITDRRRYPLVAAGLLLLGLLIEIAQQLMGLGRTAEWRDFLANMLGVATALALAYAGLGSWMVQIEQRLGLS